jgi:hypothetical protein
MLCSIILKLRFESKREDYSALYDYIEEYTRLVTTICYCCHLDNCYSTPFWFAQELMSYRRQIN